MTREEILANIRWCEEQLADPELTDTCAICHRDRRACRAKMLSEWREKLEKAE